MRSRRRRGNPDAAGLLPPDRVWGGNDDPGHRPTPCSFRRADLRAPTGALRLMPSQHGDAQWTDARSSPPAPLWRCSRSPKRPLSPSPPRAATRGSTLCSRTSSASGCATRPSSRPRSVSTRDANADLRSKLDTRPAPVARRENLARTRRAIARLRAIGPSSLSDSARLNREVVLYQLQASTVAPTRWGIARRIRPYPIFQQGGSYFSVPDFLNSAHTINNAADAEAYLARLDAVATLLDNDSAEQRAQAARGFLAPGWSIDLTARPDAQAARRRRAAEQRWSSRWPAGPGTRISRATGSGARRRSSTGAVYPALDRQIALMSELRPTSRPATAPGGCPDGDGDLRRGAAADDHDQLHRPTRSTSSGSSRSPRSARSSTRSCARPGFTSGSVGERLAALNVARAALPQHRRRAAPS